jgi:hypothetical protein
VRRQVVLSARSRRNAVGAHVQLGRRRAWPVNTPGHAPSRGASYWDGWARCRPAQFGVVLGGQHKLAPGVWCDHREIGGALRARYMWLSWTGSKWA